MSDHASEYGRLLAERDRLIAQGVDPADLELPKPPATPASPLLPDLTPGNLDRNGELAERMDALPIEDVIRVLVTAGHSLWHRAPKRATHEGLVAELRAGIDDLHRLGLP